MNQVYSIFTLHLMIRLVSLTTLLFTSWRPVETLNQIVGCKTSKEVTFTDQRNFLHQYEYWGNTLTTDYSLILKTVGGLLDFPSPVSPLHY